MNENHFRQHKNPKKNVRCIWTAPRRRAKTVTNCKIQSRKRNSFYQTGVWYLVQSRQIEAIQLYWLVNSSCSLESKGGAVVRALASHQCGSGSTPYVGWVFLSVLSLTAPRGFSTGIAVISSPQKWTFPNSNSTRNQVDEELLCRCATS